MAEWICKFCTIKNEPQNIICSMCFQDRFPAEPEIKSSAPPSENYGAWGALALPDYNKATEIKQPEPPAYIPPPSYNEIQNIPAIGDDRLDDWSDDSEEVVEGMSVGKMKAKDSWGGGDDEEEWSSCEEEDETVPDIEEKTLADIGWQCVKCSGRNSKYDKNCHICRESRNPMMFCDICKCEVPFLCFEEHQKAHKIQGQVSPISIAFSLIEKLRNFSSVPSCVCWDFAKDFVQKYKDFLEAGYGDEPMIIYHWTDQKNFGSIIDANLKVPDGRTVAVVNGSAHGVGIYAHTDPFWGKNYGKGAKKMIMCLALKGHCVAKHGRERTKQHFDTTKYGEVYVFYHQHQILPIYNIEPGVVKSVLPLTKQVVGELSLQMKQSLGRQYDDHDPYSGLSLEQKKKIGAFF